MPILNELEYRYRTNLVSSIERYKGLGYWIHFSEMPKMGVRPVKTFHGDPKGVYFYALDWLLQSARFEEGIQYATKFPYWTIVELKESPDGIVFRKTKEAQYQALADRNNWERWEPQLKAGKAANEKLPKIFWRYLKTLPSADPNRALRGVPYIVDDGLGIIHYMEPEQLLVLDPRCIRVIDHGQQSPADWKTREAKDPMGEHRYMIVEFFKQLRGQHGGELVWNKKIPSLVINRSGAQFTITVRKAGMFNAYIAMESVWGRATNSDTITVDKLHNMSMTTATEYFSKVIEHITMLASKKKDLFFTPHKSEKQAIADIKSLIDSSFEIKTEIDNKSAYMNVSARKTVTEGGVELNISVYAWTDKNKSGYGVWGKIGSYHVLEARAETIEELPDMIKSSLYARTEMWKKSDREKYNRYFYYDEDFVAFLGWISYNSGITVLQDNKTEIEAFNKIDRDMLLGEIKRVF